MDPVNEADLDWTDYDHGPVSFRRKQLGEAAGGTMLGCSLYEQPPGSRSWPYHYHTNNEEALFVLEGEGEVRLGGETVPVSAGDYVSLPADERGAHRVVTDEGSLRYLIVSTMREPDVTIYPDAGTFGVFVGEAPGGRAERELQGFYRPEDAVEYWSMEDSARGDGAD